MGREEVGFVAAAQERRATGKGVPMRSCYRQLMRLLASEDGPTAVEYAVMLALIITVCFGAITTLGGNTSQVFSNKTLNNTVGLSSS
jgi:pilus assembly protein Flp/PilA